MAFAKIARTVYSNVTEPLGYRELQITLVLVALYLLYRWAIRPLNRIRLLGDVGLYFGKPEIRGIYRERQIERLKLLRQKGELPPVFPNGWYCIAESDELKPKELMEVTVLGQFFTLMRSESGNVHMMEPYCPHLGANFNIGGKVVNDNCVQCPFHGWIFNAETGRCASIPYNEGTIPEQAKVCTWPIVEKNRNIYVWYHAEGEQPEWEIPEFDQIKTGEWSYGGRTEHEIMSHCQEIPENGADVAHLNYLHLSGPTDGSDIVKLDLPDKHPTIQHVWDGSWTAGIGASKHIGTMILKQYMTFLGYRIPLTSSYLKAEQLGPGIVLMNFDFGPLGKGVVFQHVTPEQPLQQRVRFVMYANLPKWFCKFFMWSEANQFERDIFIWSNKKYVKHPLVVKNDGPIVKHRRWYSQFYTENSPILLPNGDLSTRAKSVYDW